MAVGFSQCLRLEHSLGQGKWQAKEAYSVWRAGNGVYVGTGPWQDGEGNMNPNGSRCNSY